MNRALRFIIVFGFLFSAPVWAVNMICPGSARFVASDDSVATVIATCGNPLQQVSSKVEPLTSEKVLEWQYVKGFPVSHKFSVQFENGKVHAMQVDGRIVHASNYCSETMINPGDLESKVASLCGHPVIVNVLQEHRKKVDRVILIYQEHPYLPRQVFTFMEDKLISKEIVNP